MTLDEFTLKYPHCKSWADCRTLDEQRAFIFGWGSLKERVAWLAEHPSEDNIRFAFVQHHEAHGRAVEDASLSAFQRGFCAGLQHSGQIAEPSGSRINIERGTNQ